MIKYFFLIILSFLFLNLNNVQSEIKNFDLEKINDDSLNYTKLFKDIDKLIKDNSIVEYYYAKSSIEKLDNFIYKWNGDSTILYDAYYLRGICYFKSNKLENALDNFNLVINYLEIDSSRIYAQYLKCYLSYYYRGIIYYIDNDLYKSIIDLRKILNNSIINNDFRMLDNDLLIKIFNKSLLINNYNSIDYFIRGKIYYNNENYKQALSDFSKALKLDNKNYFIFYYLGLTYYKYNRFYTGEDKENLKNAVINFDNVIKLNNFIKNAYIFKAKSLTKLKEYEDAIDCLKEGMKVPFDSTILYSDLALNYEECEKHNLAIYYYTLSIKNNQNNAENYLRRGEIYIKIKYIKNAIIDFENAIKLGHEKKRNIEYRLEELYKLL